MVNSSGSLGRGGGGGGGERKLFAAISQLTDVPGDGSGGYGLQKPQKLEVLQSFLSGTAYRIHALRWRRRLPKSLLGLLNINHCSKILILVSNLKGNGSRRVAAPPKAKGIVSQPKEKPTWVSNVIRFQEQMVPLSPGKCLCPWKLELA